MQNSILEFDRKYTNFKKHYESSGVYKGFTKVLG